MTEEAKKPVGQSGSKSLAADGSTTISKGEWLKRCAARFIEVADIDEETAEQLAETSLESTIEFEDTESTPEECADGEMSYWND